MNISDDLPYVVTWVDSEPTGATGWLVIDSLRNGVATGGLFMHPDARLKEVADLAASMTKKNALQVPAIGGAKGGIRFDHTHPDSVSVLQRYLIDHKPYIETIWGTGADLNTNNEVIHRIICNELKLPSSLYSLGKKLGNLYGIENQAGSLLECIHQPVAGFTLGEYATGFSIAVCIKKLSAFSNVIIQGWGTVGRSLGYLIQNEKLGKVVGIIEQNYFLFHDQGLDVNKLLSIRESCINHDKINMDDYLLKVQALGYGVIKRTQQQTDEDFLTACLRMPADMFCPCATRYVVTDRISECLLKYTFKDKNREMCWLISGANNVFASNSSIKILSEGNINILPEWLSNSGNTLLYNEILKQANTEERTAEKILIIISQRIQSFLEDAISESKEMDILLYDACCSLIEKEIRKDLLAV